MAVRTMKGQFHTEISGCLISIKCAVCRRRLRCKIKPEIRDEQCEIAESKGTYNAVFQLENVMRKN